MVHPAEIKRRAREMRSAGASYSDVMSALELSKSTVKYMVRGISLTDEQRRELNSRPSPTSFKKGQQSTAVCRAAGCKGGRATWSKNNRARALVAARRNICLANLTYRTDELNTKLQLERLFGRRFQKEQIGRRVVDFACDELIIEHSVDGTKGIQDVIARFEDIADDPRQKIAIVDTKKLGDRRRARLESVVDEIRDYRALA